MLFALFACSRPSCPDLAAAVSASVTAGSLPLVVELDPDASCGPEPITDYAWDLGDGTTAVSQGPLTHTFLGSGTHTVTLTITDQAGSTSSDTVDIEVAAESCPTLAEVETWGTVSTAEITEASGIVSSTLTPGILWTHNDSGDSPRIFAIDEQGALRGVWALGGAPSGDWEDIARGADPQTGQPLLYIGDIGDNSFVRGGAQVFVVPEPVPGDDDDTVTIEDYAVLELTYPEGASYNAETLLVDPVSEDLYIISKDYGGETVIFRKPPPHEHGTQTELEVVAEVDFSEDPLSGGATTGGDINALGNWIIIRTYASAFLFLRDGSAPLWEALTSAPCEIDDHSEPQGEAIAFTADGGGYLTLSEGSAQPLLFTALTPAP